MNKKGERVNRVQLRESERCLRDFQREKLTGSMTFDACTTADRKGRVLRAEQKTATREDKKCDRLNVPPHFAYTDSATVNAASVTGALALTYEIFGTPPVPDANLATRAANAEMAQCQFEMLKRAGGLENAVLKEANKVIKTALKDERVGSAGALEDELQRVFFSSNTRINSVRDRLVRGVNRKCADLQVSPDTIFPGYDCANQNPNLSQVETCVIAASRCEACVKINAFDALNLDCDQADDRVTNGSCP